MGANDAGKVVKQARVRRGLSKNKLGRQLGELPESGRWFDAAGITRIEEAGAVKVDHELVQRLIDVLGLDLADASERLGVDAADLWEAAGLWPPDLDAEGYRDFVGAAKGHAARTGHAAPLNAASNPRPFRDVTYRAPLRRAA